MNKKIRSILFFVIGLCGLWLSSCSPKIPDQTEIIILSTTDIHGKFDYLPVFSAFVKETRTKYENVIVVDGGDRFTGNPYNDLYEKKQFPIVDLMNLVGFDVMVIGNHEFDFGIEVLNERIQETRASVIMANIDFKSSGLEGLVEPYHIVNKNGIKIAFLGLSNVDKQTGKPAVLAKRIEGIEFFDPIETALHFRYLRKESHVFVALTHIGFTEDRALAYAMPELDLIIGGHSHTMLEKPIILNGVMITQAGQHARQIGKTKILLEKGVITEITNEIIDLSTWDKPVDHAIVERVKDFEGNRFWERPFATLLHEIPNVEQLSYMATDAAIALPGVDFSLLNFSGIRAERLSAGPITYGDILRLSPFNNFLVIVGLKPSGIQKFIEQRTDFLSPAGFEYTARKTPDGTRVERMMLPNGQILDENKTYYLAIDNFLFSRYLSEHSDYANFTDVFVVDNIVNFLRNNPNVDYRNRPVRARPAERNYMRIANAEN
jgi:2',3'-cyclic-nucleotide 2'-phosphodiesterase (5'-nucleotidase family)